VSPDSQEHANYSHYIVSDTNKHFKFGSDRKLNPWLKIWTKFLDVVTGHCKIEKTTVYLLFFLFIQFSAIEIRSVFSHTNLMTSWLQWLKKNWGARARWWAKAIFQLTELNIKANPSCFQHERARAHAYDTINYVQ